MANCKFYIKGGKCNHKDAPNPGHSRCVVSVCEVQEYKVKPLTMTYKWEKLSGIPQLLKQISVLETGDMGEWVSLGIATEQELTILHTANSTQMQIQNWAEKQAEKDYPRPDYDAHLPKEYLELTAKRTKLKEVLDLREGIMSALRQLSGKSMFDPGAAEKYGVRTVATSVLEEIKQEPFPIYLEHSVLSTQIERKERTGTKVRNIRNDLSRVCYDGRKQAKQDYILAGRKKETQVFEEEQRVERLINQRRAKLIQPYKQQIKEILESYSGS